MLCTLHNFLRRKYASTYTPIGSLYDDDHIGLRTDALNLVDIQRGHYRSISRDAKQTRDQFLHYFNNEGSVPWQNSMV